MTTLSLGGFDKLTQRWDRAASAEGFRRCSVCRREAWWEAISAAQGQGSRLGRLAKGRREEQVGGRGREYEVAYVRPEDREVWEKRVLAVVVTFLAGWALGAIGNKGSL